MHPTIPWYRSTVFTAGLTAALVQLAAMMDATFIERLVSGQHGALAQLGGFILTSIVVGARAIASAEPITLSQAHADAANEAAAARKQGGFARPLVLAFLLATAVMVTPVLHGCAALGLQAPKSFNESYAYTLGQTTALRSAATTALQAKQITTADAEYVLHLTDESRKLLDNASALVQAGEAAKGQTQLELAASILTQLQTYLNARAKK